MCKYVCLQEPSYYPFCKISFFSWNINNNNTNLGQVTAHTFEKNVYLLHQSVEGCFSEGALALFPVCRCALPRENVEQLLPSLTLYMLKCLSLSPPETHFAVCVLQLWQPRWPNGKSGWQRLPAAKSPRTKICQRRTFTLLKRLASAVRLSVCLSVCLLPLPC